MSKYGSDILWLASLPDEDIPPSIDEMDLSVSSLLQFQIRYFGPLGDFVNP